ncbi:MAG: hypothetical protein QOD77_1001 [Thermoplasmata archaeon]|jgi:DNA helicase HerA-like ATPase|nr:hypothetical protein [Thermoplasmata archaeon]
MASLRRQVGVIYGNVSSTGFDIAVSDGDLKRLDYVEVEAEGHRVLGQVEAVTRRSSLSYEEAIAMPAGFAADAEDQLSATIRIIGYRDPQGRIQTPRSPFRAGIPVHSADDRLVTSILGLEQNADEGAYLGFVKGSRIPVTLSMDTLAQKHLSVLAKTGAGKSYTVGVILEEFLKAKVPLVILDPHGEYGTLRSPNLDEREMETMGRYRIKPKSFQSQVKEFALDTNLNPEAARLVLEGMNLEGREIVDLLGGKLSGGQVGVLYQAIKEVKEHLPAYTLRDIMDGVARNKSNAKWNVLNALELLESTKVFDIRGTPVRELVSPGQCTIINLKGVSPDIQEVVVTRIAGMLWEARKRNEVPAHILVVEEAHNFCPERNVGNAVSGPIIRTVASEGRKFGLGLVIVSQRPAKIDKNVLSQCNTQVVLKVTNPNDLKAIVQSVEGISNEVADEVQRLAVGEALVAGGGLTQPVFVSVRPRMTAHGGRSVSVLHADEDEEEEPAPAPLARPVVPPLPPAPMAAPAKPSTPPPMPPPAWTPDLSAAPAVAPPPAAPVAPAPRRLVAPEAELRPKARATWLQSDAREIHRVAARIGIVGASQSPERSLEVLRDLEASFHRDPDERLRLLREVADNACHEEEPACIRCPMRDVCQFHRELVAERQKGRGAVRRLWQ